MGKPEYPGKLPADRAIPQVPARVLQSTIKANHMPRHR
jgi:hypothetical protein